MNMGSQYPNLLTKLDIVFSWSLSMHIHCAFISVSAVTLSLNNCARSRQIADVASPGSLYSKLMDIIVRFARAGLIHGDYNEFNILVRRETGEPIVIDFPQMVSTSHVNAEMYALNFLFIPVNLTFAVQVLQPRCGVHPNILPTQI